jgi:hypothetical protein
MTDNAVECNKAERNSVANEMVNTCTVFSNVAVKDICIKVANPSSVPCIAAHPRHVREKPFPPK